MSALLEVRGLTLELRTPRGPVLALEDLELTLAAGETLALVGESGSGKTLTALALMGLLPRAARVVGGEVRLRGTDLLTLPAAERRAMCGRELAMSFQEPGAALNPVLRVGEQVAESLRHHAGLPRAAARQRAHALLGEVGFPQPELHARRYPHELSGGQRQRVMLAVALALGPSLLIADEPTSALDAPLQRELLARLGELTRQREMALLLITHDLAVVAALATRVTVLYAGRVVEEAGVQALFRAPSHPYTLGLLRSRPERLAPLEAFRALPGQVPALGEWPAGCRFHPRCVLADERCTHDRPRLLPAPPAPGERSAPVPAVTPVTPELRPPDASLGLRAHRAACHHAGEGGPP